MPTAGAQGEQRPSPGLIPDGRAALGATEPEPTRRQAPAAAIGAAAGIDGLEANCDWMTVVMNVHNDSRLSHAPHMQGGLHRVLAADNRDRPAQAVSGYIHRLPPGSAATATGRVFKGAPCEGFRMPADRGVRKCWRSTSESPQGRKRLRWGGAAAKSHYPSGWSAAYLCPHL